ncbi:MAG: type II toxin-antitoxin system Phd/YefM family antitoxin [Gemmatimonadaceae bacterium]
MAVKVSYSRVRAHLAEIWNEVEDTRDVAVLQRRGHEDMALLPADELASLRETVYLLRSPVDAARLLAALTRARRGKTAAQNLASHRAELGLPTDSGR